MFAPFLKKQCLPGIRPPRAVGRVPRLLARDHVHKKIPLIPIRNQFFMHPARVFREQNFPDLELAVARMRAHRFIKIYHNGETTSPA